MAIYQPRNAQLAHLLDTGKLIIKFTSILGGPGTLMMFWLDSAIVFFTVKSSLAHDNMLLILHSLINAI
jgi:hypothetical protein